MKVSMFNKLNQLPESLKNSLGLVTLTIIIFFTFFILNIFYGPSQNVEFKKTQKKKTTRKRK